MTPEDLAKPNTDLYSATNQYHRRKTKPGDIHGCLTVMDISHRDSHAALFYICKCECGNIVTIRGRSLRNGDAKSCGKGCRKPKARVEPEKAARNRVLSEYKRGAKDRGLWFLLSDEQFDRLIKADCFYCGCEPSNVNKGRRGSEDFVYQGIDRLDAEAGYYESNCVPCCKICNHAKTNMDFTMFFAWIECLTEKRKTMTPEQIGKVQTESAQQSAFFCWCAMQARTDPRFKWVFAIPNGGLRDKREASNLVKQGVRCGVPDVFIPIPCGQYHGMFIEFKKPGIENHRDGGLKPDQVLYRDFLLSQNYGHFVAYSYLSAIEVVVNYLSHD
jgi:hypothetical protein